jgi:1-acyl-sn-glycerol-3-phosphate acyltransferase
MTDRTDPPPGRPRRATGASAVAAGAARASGERERRRRRTTPLLADLEAAASATDHVVEPVNEPVVEPVAPAVARRAEPVPAPERAATPKQARPRAPKRAPAARRTSGGKRLVAVTDLATEAGVQIADLLESAPPPGELQAKITAILEFVRRRLTGDYAVDEFGFDPELNDTIFLALFRVLYRRWFRVEVRGIDNVPATGGALIVANHAGAIALDSVMMQVALHDEHPQHRHLRPLAADLVFQAPVLGEVARKAGATLANSADAERLLAAGELVGVWPEGFKGIGKPFSERYKLQRFGRGGFVSAALRTGVPIVPLSVVGAEEIYPLVGNLPVLARLLGVPYIPITPFFPWLGPLGMVPLPSKWLMEFGEPIRTDELEPGAADDPMLVFNVTDQVRETIQQTLYSLLRERGSAFG